MPLFFSFQSKNHSMAFSSTSPFLSGRRFFFLLASAAVLQMCYFPSVLLAVLCVADTD
jgi:hypothetical protein